MKVENSHCYCKLWTSCLNYKKIEIKRQVHHNVARCNRKDVNLGCSTYVTPEGFVLGTAPPAHICDQGWENSPMPCGFQVELNCLGAVPQSHMEALTTAVQNALFLRWSWQEPVLQQLCWLSICIWMKIKRLLFLTLTLNISLSPPFSCPSS